MTSRRSSASSPLRFSTACQGASQSTSCGTDVSAYSPPPSSYACRSNGLSRYGLRRISQSTNEQPR